MYAALIKHQVIRPSALHITKFARASVSGKTHPNTKGNEEFFLNTTFPDDFESTPLNPEALEKQAQKAKGQSSDVHYSTADIAAHKADIYESIYPTEGKKGAKGKKSQDLPDQVPNIDEM
ncbi:uncharacterized protein N7482_005664 [Penicillium canariense]|uniref:Uncharacterized protein n=1 Tax=Penicillium canariense TaxID=189055 RepID=A0A9W9LNN5_9EURO|nr:uncharacterized protein N7482_005664 [Penicillium canariense]KAJ5166883.1 hypothetical protein N7482_005664 [Penicillium canariense]